MEENEIPMYFEDIVKKESLEISTKVFKGEMKTWEEEDDDSFIDEEDELLDWNDGKTCIEAAAPNSIIKKEEKNDRNDDVFVLNLNFENEGKKRDNITGEGKEEIDGNGGDCDGEKGKEVNPYIEKILEKEKRRKEAKEKENKGRKKKVERIVKLDISKANLVCQLAKVSSIVQQSYQQEIQVITH